MFGWLKKHKRVPIEVSCYHCGEPIFIGDKVEWLRIEGKNYLEHKRCSGA